MASSGTERADEEAASPSAAAATDDVDSGWSDAPKAGKAAPVEPTNAEGAELAPTKPSDALAPVEAAPADAASPPPVEPSVAPLEPPPLPVEPVTAPAPPAPAPIEVKSSAVEPKAPPVEPVRVKPEPAVAEASYALAAPSAFVALFRARPNGAWLAIGGVALVIAFVAGILTGRGSRSAPERPVATHSVPAPTVVPPPVASEAEPHAAASSTPVAVPSASAAPTKHALMGFNAQAAKLAIDRVVPRLKGCKQPGEPPGSATVTVTFAPTGRVSDARVTTTRYAGTRTGSCIAQRLHEARIPEFAGKPTTVKRGITVR